MLFLWPGAVLILLLEEGAEVEAAGPATAAVAAAAHTRAAGASGGHGAILRRCRLAVGDQVLMAQHLFRGHKAVIIAVHRAKLLHGLPLGVPFVQGDLAVLVRVAL